MDRLDAMNVLLAVVEAGSLSGAGRRLGMPLATVSRKLMELEAHLKARLLHRSTRKLELTDAGRGYVYACKRIIDDVNQAERAVAGEYSAPQGELVITAPVAFGRLHVLPVVTAFLRDFPAVHVRLQLGDRISHLLDEHIDLALRIGTLPDSSYKVIALGELRQVVCGSPEYLATHGVPLQPGDLAAHACIGFDPSAASDTWTLRSGTSMKADLHVRIAKRLTVNTAEAAVDAAVDGLGLTRVLSYQADSAIRFGGLLPVLEGFEPAPIPVSLVFHAQQRMPLKLRAFIDMAAPRLRKNLRRLAEPWPTPLAAAPTARRAKARVQHSPAVKKR